VDSVSDRLAGKVAIVTGAGTGIGRATAQVYAEEGAKVVAGDIREAEGEQTAAAIREAGGEAIFVRCDVGNEDEVRALVEAAEREYGRLDVMTANAGMLGRGGWKTIEELSKEEFEETIDVNLVGTFLSFKHAIPAIRRAGGGAMTATASLAAHRGQKAVSAYCASKGGIVALVRSIALELYPTIRVNAVSPGNVETLILEHAAEAKGKTPEELLASLMPPGTERPKIVFADPREIGLAHLFLVSDESSFINGQALIADGGKSSFMPVG
jgi:NAD(P)-dependent dehydrogenase (short-subunit alcohol dehydrogenase family)